MHRCFAPDGACDLPALADRLRPYTSAIQVRDLILADRQGRRRGDAVRGMDRQLPHALVIEAERLTDSEVRILPAVIEAGQPALYVGAPVVLDGTRVGVILLELPLDGLDAVLQVARAGESGETYAFDDQGTFVSQSRFVAQLHRAGLLANTTGNAALAVALRDPGVDLTVGSRASLPRDQQPLTRMARDAVVGGDGVDVTGYRDYRGVPVVGAWRWLPEFGIGVATEEDHEEAFAALSMLYRLFGALLAILTLCMRVADRRDRCSSAACAPRALRAQDIAERFGQYRIVRKLGEGGMGSVYLADHEMLRRPAVIAGLTVGLMSEILVGSISEASESVGLSEFFIGAIVVAIVGNAAEHWVAVLVAYKDKMDLSVNIAIGSAAQIALFVGPVLVIASFLIGPGPLPLVFNGFELGAILLAILIANTVTSDGESNWFEGVQLLAVYAIVGIAFYYA